MKKLPKFIYDEEKALEVYADFLIHEAFSVHLHRLMRFIVMDNIFSLVCSHSKKKP